MYIPDDPANPAVPGSAPAPGSNAPSLPADVAQELAALREYRQRSEDFYTRLEPHKERVERLLAEEEAARVFDDSYSAYKTLQEQRKPKLPPEWDPEQNPFLKRMMSVADRVDSWDKRDAEGQKRAQEQAQQSQVQDAYVVAEKLCQEYPFLAENNYERIQDIAALAVTRKVPFAEAAERYMAPYRDVATKSATPPRSLRAAVGAPGVPTETPKPKDDERSLFEITRERLNQQRRKGA